MPQISFPSSIGNLTLSSEGKSINALTWESVSNQDTSPLLENAKAQILEYLDGRLEVFDLPLSPKGTEFQIRVWSAMQNIPYGCVRTYGALAEELRSGPRPVGAACGANPIPIIIPCHRVVASNGRGGYSGGSGLVTKQTLLNLEGQQLNLI